ncbi:MAG: family 10 glycosylhydrolase [Bacteroidales bacterium]
MKKKLGLILNIFFVVFFGVSIIFILAHYGNSAIDLSPNQSKKIEFWTWMNDPISADAHTDSLFAELNDVGIDGVIIGAPAESLRKIIPVAHKYGIKVHAWTWIMNSGSLANKHPEWLDYNALGQSIKDDKAYVGYYKFISPAIKEARDSIIAHITKISSIDSLDGISLDYCRYVDVILPSALWKNYDIHQDKVFAKWDYGYHPSMLSAFKDKYGYSPLDKIKVKNDYDTIPYIKDWIDFRCEILNSLVKEITDICHEKGVKVSASPFPTPKMAKKMVYQDWGAWNLDIVFPMSYNGFYNENLQWVCDDIKDCVRDSKCPNQIYAGIYASDLFSLSIDEVVTKCIEAGANGISIFMYSSLLPSQKKELKKVINKY